nr:rhomboid family intramembrane serine protease [Marinifaba aquimaris]
MILIFFVQLSVNLGAARFLVGALHFPVNLSDLGVFDLYRLWTPILLHGDWAHFVFNALWWVWLGDKIEKHQGWGRLVNVTLLTALFAHVAQFYLVGANFVGLSGVIYGLFAYVWVVGRKTDIDAFKLPGQLIGMLLLWMAIGFADVLWINMANWAHLFGFIAGLGLAFWHTQSKKADD